MLNLTDWFTWQNEITKTFKFLSCTSAQPYNCRTSDLATVRATARFYRSPQPDLRCFTSDTGPAWPVFCLALCAPSRQPPSQPTNTRATSASVPSSPASSYAAGVARLDGFCSRMFTLSPMSTLVKLRVCRWMLEALMAGAMVSTSSFSRYWPMKGQACWMICRKRLDFCTSKKAFWVYLSWQWWQEITVLSHRSCQCVKN